MDEGQEPGLGEVMSIKIQPPLLGSGTNKA